MEIEFEMISEMYSEKLVGYERTDGIGLEKSLIQKRLGWIFFFTTCFSVWLTPSYRAELDESNDHLRVVVSIFLAEIQSF